MRWGSAINVCSLVFEARSFRSSPAAVVSQTNSPRAGFTHNYRTPRAKLNPYSATFFCCDPSSPTKNQWPRIEPAIARGRASFYARSDHTKVAFFLCFVSFLAKQKRNEGSREYMIKSWITCYSVTTTRLVTTIPSSDNTTE